MGRSVTATSSWGFWVSFVLLLGALSLVSGNAEGDALYALRQSLTDPDGALNSWDQNLVDPCTWYHITCDSGSHVTRIDLQNYNLGGHLVPELGSLEYLQHLELFMNHIEGTIPPELGNLKNLISLDLNFNNISGTIPPELGNLTSLVFLRLNNNKLTGRVPSELSNIKTLKAVDFSHNDLCGTIPTTPPYKHIPLENFKNNPRLVGPQLLGLASYDTDCD